MQQQTRETRFEVMGTPLGSGECVRYSRHGTIRWPNSTVYICPVCGASWGKIHIAGSPYFPSRRLCPEHGNGFMLPTNWYGEHTAFPLEILKREVLRIAELSNPRSYEIELITAGN